MKGTRNLKNRKPRKTNGNPDFTIAFANIRWFGHVRCSDDLSSVMDKALPGKRGRGRPCKTFEECVRDDIKLCNMEDVDPLDRDYWIGAVRYSRQAVLPPVGELG